MAKRTRILLAAGVLLAVVALAVRVVGDPVLIRFPLNIDQTLRYTGTATVYADPATGARLATPLHVPLTVDRHVKVVSGDYTHAVVQETDAITFAGATHTTTYQYYMNRRTMQLVNGPKSYALGKPANVMAAGDSYRVNFPLDTQSRTYNGWAPETDSIAPATPAGPSHHDPLSGDQVITFNTKLDHPVAAYYQAFLQSMGMPASLPAATVISELQAAGADPAKVLGDLAPHLSAAQLAALTGALSKPVPLRYSYFQQGQIAVQTKTGAVVGTDVPSEGVAVTPDTSGVAAAAAVLAPYADVPSVQALAKAVSSLSQTQPVFSMAYTETPASVRAAASAANSQGARMNLVQWQLPIGIGAVALAVLLTAAIWRPRPRPGRAAAGRAEPGTMTERKAA